VALDSFGQQLPFVLISQIGTDGGDDAPSAKRRRTEGGAESKAAATSCIWTLGSLQHSRNGTAAAFVPVVRFRLGVSRDDEVQEWRILDGPCLVLATAAQLHVLSQSQAADSGVSVIAGVLS
jgi:hypothetical protein